MPDKVILLAVQDDASFVSQFQRPVRLHRLIVIVQQLRDFFTVSIQTARSIIADAARTFAHDSRPIL